MPHGGARPGAGRPKGAKNKVTAAREAAIAESGMTPLEFVLSVLRDEDAPTKERMWAARVALPLCHSKIRPIKRPGFMRNAVGAQGRGGWWRGWCRYRYRRRRRLMCPTLVVRLEPFRFEPVQGVFLGLGRGRGIFFKLGQGVEFRKPLFMGETNHLDLDPGGIDVGRDWSELGMAKRQGHPGRPHSFLGGGVLIAEHGKHKFQGRHAALGNRGLSGSSDLVGRPFLPSAPAFPWC